ncbi:RNaseH domain-containing protein [Embleya sp. NPDC059237]|uniref:RNaseH domain-containing protein n=1 Tax=Embleya sp. NPDC059237 TaxID=3346784 RepID=UPI00369DECA1
MSTRETHLSLLACHTDEELLGTVHLYPLPDKIEAVWRSLREEYRGVTGSTANLPYAGLLTVLRAIGYTSATLYPQSKTQPPRFLATTVPIDPDDLYTAVTLWEQALLLTPKDRFSFGYFSLLADLIAGTAPERVSLWEHITRTGACIDAPGWVWTAAGWAVVRRLSAQPWTIDDKAVNLRPDLENSLQVWDNDLLWSSTWSAAHGDSPPQAPAEPGGDDAWKHVVRYATLRLEVAAKSHPGLPGPVIVVRPRVSRLSNTLRNTRTAWFAPRDPTGPLLNLALSGKGKNTHLEHTTRLALDAWIRMKGEHVFPRNDDGDDFLPLEALDLSGPPGNLRALIPNSTHYPLGKGVGMFTHRELARHLPAALGQPLLRTREIAGRHFGHGRTTDAGRDTVLLDDEDFDLILAAAGCRRLRILALYRTQDMRTRMQRLLAYHFNRPDLAAEGIPDTRLTPVTDHVEVLLQPAPELLAHGDHHDRRPALTAELAGLDAPDGTRVLALCETEYDAKEWARRRRLSKLPDSTVQDPDTLDAKHRVNALLARHGVLAQFLTPQKRNPRTNPRKKNREAGTDLERLAQELESDHRGHMAVADLNRVAGLVHPRLTKALTFGPHGIKEPLVHVGLHMRQQLGARRGRITDEPKLVWTLVALVPHDGRWRTLAYLPDEHRTAGTWLDYATANRTFRARPLPDGRRRDALLPRSIDHALYTLGAHARTASGYVVHASGEQTRSIWPLMANRHLGKVPDGDGLIDNRPALPGFTLPADQRPRAVVRVTSGGDDLAPPALIERLVHTDGEEDLTEGKLATGLFRMEHSDDTFILCNLPHQYRGGSRYARAGEHYSRWASTDAKEQAETWYSHTTTEITVLHHPATQPLLAHALAAARLCDHALHWNHRTRYPAPIHLGIQMDKNHPEYRRTVDACESDNDL